MPTIARAFMALDSHTYVGFEDQFRGSQDDIRARVAEYLPVGALNRVASRSRVLRALYARVVALDLDVLVLGHSVSSRSRQLARKRRPRNGRALPRRKPMSIGLSKEELALRDKARWLARMRRARAFSP